MTTSIITSYVVICLQNVLLFTIYRYNNIMKHKLCSLHGILQHLTGNIPMTTFKLPIITRLRHKVVMIGVTMHFLYSIVTTTGVSLDGQVLYLFYNLH